MSKKFVGNMVFQAGCLAGVAYSNFVMNETILGLVFLAIQIGISLMNWED